MSKKKIITPEDVKICGFAIHRLYTIMYPNGLTPEELKQLSKQHKWLKRIYDLVVIGNGI
jgi:hypothetical protein